MYVIIRVRWFSGESIPCPEWHPDGTNIFIKRSTEASIRCRDVFDHMGHYRGLQIINNFHYKQTFVREILFSDDKTTSLGWVNCIIVAFRSTWMYL